MTERQVLRVVGTQIQPGGSTDHTVRMVLEPGHFKEYDPFLFLAEDWFIKGTFGDHPHRGIETVTVVLEGALEHADNHGGHGVLNAGDAQWMTAGRGLIHREEPYTERVHTLQLWINLPASLKMAEPRYQDLRSGDMPVRREPGTTLRVFSGSSGSAEAVTKNHVLITMVELKLEAGATTAIELPATDNAFFYLLSGSGRFGSKKEAAQTSQVVWLTRSEEETVSRIAIEATESLHAILWAGKPVHEPVVAYGPFVMNSMEEIEKAYEDFREGRF